jgi:hypothetical protein
MIVTTDGTGSYSTSWTPPYPGSYLLTASWGGNNQFAGSTSASASLTVTGSVAPSATVLLNAPTAASRGQTVTLSITVFNPTSSVVNENVAVQITGPGNYVSFNVIQVQVAASSQSTAYYDWTIPNQSGAYVIIVSPVPPQSAAYATATVQVS